nr:DNA-directed RNA polymerase V subunit 5C [Ipomoea trifida]
METQSAPADNIHGGSCITSFIDRGSVESHRYFLARRTLLEMLRDRGYAVPDSELCRSLSDFRSSFGDRPAPDRLRFSTHRTTSPTKKILVIFCGTEEIRKKVIVGILLQIVNKESLEKVVLVLQSKMNFYAKKVVDEYPVKVETFQITDLLINVTKHIAQPEHEILTAEEKAKLLKAYNIEENQMPRMYQTDAIARYSGLKKGQVVKFTHQVPPTGSAVTYRCVV